MHGYKLGYQSKQKNENPYCPQCYVIKFITIISINGMWNCAGVIEVGFGLAFSKL